MTGIRIHDFNCGLKAYRRDVVKAVNVYGELHRYIPVLAHWEGFKVGEMLVHHRARRFGKTKFGFGRFWKGFLDLLTVIFTTRYFRRPLHLFGLWGLVALLVGPGHQRLARGRLVPGQAAEQPAPVPRGDHPRHRGYPVHFDRTARGNDNEIAAQLRGVRDPRVHPVRGARRSLSPRPSPAMVRAQAPSGLPPPGVRPLITSNCRHVPTQTED